MSAEPSLPIAAQAVAVRMSARRFVAIGANALRADVLHAGPPTDLDEALLLQATLKLVGIALGARLPDLAGIGRVDIGKLSNQSFGEQPTTYPVGDVDHRTLVSSSVAAVRKQPVSI